MYIIETFQRLEAFNGMVLNCYFESVCDDWIRLTSGHRVPIEKRLFLGV